MRFLIGREKDITNSEIAQLISQSLSEPNKEKENQFDELNQVPDYQANQNDCQNKFIDKKESIPSNCNSINGNEPNEISSSTSLKDANELNLLKDKLSEWQNKFAMVNDDLVKQKYKYEEKLNEAQRELEDALVQIKQKECDLNCSKKEIEQFQRMFEDLKLQYTTVEKKYHKAKKMIKELQHKEQGFMQKEIHLQLLREKDIEYMELVRILKDKIVDLEMKLIQVQKAAGLPVYSFNSLQEIVSEMMSRAQSDQHEKRLSVLIHRLFLDHSNENCQNLDKHNSKQVFLLEQTQLLDSSAAKQKAELASRGSLAKRQPPSSVRRHSSYGSAEQLTDNCSPRHNVSVSDKMQDDILIKSSPGSPNIERPSSLITNKLSILEQSDFYSNRRVSSASNVTTPSSSSSYISTSPNPSQLNIQNLSSPTSPNSIKSSSSSNSLSSPIHESYDDSRSDLGNLINDWNSEDVCQWFTSIKMDNYVSKIKERNITGPIVLQMDSSQMKVNKKMMNIND